MAYTPLGWSALNTADSLGTTFNSLASGSSATSAAIDNTVATLAKSAYQEALLSLVFGTAITTGSGSPYIQVAILAAPDGTNYDVTTVATGQLFPIDTSVTKPLAPSTSYGAIVANVPIPPTLFKLVILNEAGAAFDSSVTANLYRYESQAG